MYGLERLTKVNHLLSIEIVGMTPKPELATLWDEHGRNLFTDHAVSGVKVA
jgi:hypothetical protein